MNNCQCGGKLIKNKFSGCFKSYEILDLPVLYLK